VGGKGTEKVMTIRTEQNKTTKLRRPNYILNGCQGGFGPRREIIGNGPSCGGYEGLMSPKGSEEAEQKKKQVTIVGEGSKRT